MSNFKVIAINRHRFSTDGSGITTLVGLDGCPLNCKYCLNKKVLSTGKYKVMSPEELLSEIMIDYCYFIATNGGITFGGGEPLLYSNEIKRFREILPKRVHINIETSLHVSECNLLNIIDDVDEFIIDIKSSNPEIYKNYTECHISSTLVNLEHIAKVGFQSKCIIRIPNIPEFTDGEDINKTVEFVRNLGYQKLDLFDYKIK